ncbi:carbohydrate ABC transporter permease [Poriferisphaera sp. WC338]|uniref:carbohydrate ABC transporter permease n=1 Tax=Poriferisphaera sp. WC338 TaxID=3425129 RepID=UPI003D819EBF
MSLHRRRSRSLNFSKIMVYLLLVVGAFIFAMPLIWMLSTALKPIEQTMQMPPKWIPDDPQWGNFWQAIKEMRYFWTYLFNTLFLCTLTVIGTVTSSAMAAYGFSRISWRGRERTFLIVLATMMIPFPVVMVPLYCLFRSIGLTGTLAPLWLPTFFAGAFNVFLLRQFFMTLPRDLSEAARIDGCSEWRIFWQIILPLAKPTLLVVGLFQFMATWNDFLGPLIYLTDQQDFTLALGLQFFQSQHGGTQWHYLMAASALVVLPVIILFFCAQRYFIEGISMTGLKG